MQPREAGSAGTAGRDFRVEPPAHPFRPERAEWGARERCADCGRHEHDGGR